MTNASACTVIWISHQVSEVVSILSGHQPAGVAEASDVLDVGLKPRRVCLQYNVNECRQEVVSRGRLILGDLDSAEDVFAAACDARKFVPGNPLGVHLNDICQPEMKIEKQLKCRCEE